MIGSDIHHIEARHDEIDTRLREWARYVIVRPPRWLGVGDFSRRHSMGVKVLKVRIKCG